MTLILWITTSTTIIINFISIKNHLITTITNSNNNCASWAALKVKSITNRHVRSAILIRITSILTGWFHLNLINLLLLNSFYVSLDIFSTCSNSSNSCSNLINNTPKFELDFPLKDEIQKIFLPK